MICHRARHYNPEVGRFDRSDSLFLREPERCFERPEECQLYSYVANAPTRWVDRDGWRLVMVGNSSTFKQELRNAFLYLGRSSVAKQYINFLHDSEFDIFIKETTALDEMRYQYRNGIHTIYFNPHSGLSLRCGTQTPALGLLHEAIHAYDAISNIVYAHIKFLTPSTIYQSMYEQSAMSIESSVALQLGEPIRLIYNEGEEKYVKCSTCVK
jgi:RHS repeat-associated protein